MRVVGLVACGKSKHSRGVWSARDLYVGSYFRACRGYIERTCPRWAILSAKHGLLMPGDPVLPYDKTLTALPAIERRAWAEAVNRDLVSTFGSDASYVVCAGKPYRAALDGLKWTMPWGEIPLPMGRALLWLHQAEERAR